MGCGACGHKYPRNTRPVNTVATQAGVVPGRRRIRAIMPVVLLPAISQVKPTDTKKG